ncbi:hypothetical protein BSSC8_31420 [Bacillus subtilis subsp. subtilis str. SC-8]|nr:hypothetical protein BSSC8_31420 [Bacillus subtilis subsp. subtilis str. SC-8]
MCLCSSNAINNDSVAQLPCTLSTLKNTVLKQGPLSSSPTFPKATNGVDFDVNIAKGTVSPNEWLTDKSLEWQPVGQSSSTAFCRSSIFSTASRTQLDVFWLILSLLPYKFETGEMMESQLPHAGSS